MSESVQHKLIKEKARDTFLRLGYTLKSFDREIVNGYKPDLILENDYEVLFVEAVVTSDHDLADNLKYNGKPVRFVKYYSLTPWMPGGCVNRVPHGPPRIRNGRISLPKKWRDALDWRAGDQVCLHLDSGRITVENLEAKWRKEK